MSVKKFLYLRLMQEDPIGALGFTNTISRSNQGNYCWRAWRPAQRISKVFAQEYSDHDADWHILSVVRICKVHYERSLKKLRLKGIDAGIFSDVLLPVYINYLEHLKLLYDIPYIMLRDHFDNILRKVQHEAETKDMKPLLNWLDHKDHNPWVLQCFCPATTQISREDWKSTSSSTNYAESAHAQSQREGTKLSLVAAIQRLSNSTVDFFVLKLQHFLGLLDLRAVIQEQQGVMLEVWPEENLEHESWRRQKSVTISCRVPLPRLLFRTRLASSN